jgi:hypothetical protein
MTLSDGAVPGEPARACGLRLGRVATQTRPTTANIKPRTSPILKSLPTEHATKAQNEPRDGWLSAKSPSPWDYHDDPAPWPGAMATFALHDPLNFLRWFSIVRLLNTPSIQATNPL